MWRLSIPLALAIGAPASCVSRCAAETPEEGPLLSFHVGAPAGIHRCRPETWGLVAVRVANASDQPADVLATMYFAGDPNLQYARRLWLPAHSKRYSWCPILPPYSRPPPPNKDYITTAPVEIKSLLFDRSGPTEKLLRSRSEPVVESGLLSIDHSRAITGVIADDEATEEAVAAMRLNVELPPAFSILEEDFLPPVVESLEGLDQLVLASDRLVTDAAALAAVRVWLYGGGRLWIMLDQVDSATVEALLGEAFTCRVADRVGLTRVRIEGVGPPGENSEGQPREFDEPVDLVRVLATGVEVTHTVGGWPVAFWRKVGKGEGLFTTLGPRAWVRPRTARDRRPPWDVVGCPSVATEPFAQLAGRLFEPREPPLVEPRQFEPYLSEQIGYRIVSRGSVIGVLGTFCLVLLGSGVWLTWTKRLERMAWIGPTAAAVATAAFILMGLFTRKAVPPTVAVAQLVEVEPGAEDLWMTGLVAAYNQGASHARLGARRGGLFHLDMTGLDGTARRMVRGDLDAWHWEHLVLPGGVRTAPFSCATKINQPINARAVFGPDGLTGSLATGPFQALADAVIATPSGMNLAVDLDESGGFHAGTGDVLSPGQYVAGTLLSDEQRRRQSVYGELFSLAAARRYPDRPTLLAWARPLEMQFEFPDEARRVGAALLAVPLSIDRSAAGTRVTIPSPFLPYRSVAGLARRPSGAYSHARREWIELRAPSESYLRFQFPAEVLPMELDRATLTLTINAPSRTLEVSGFAGGRPVRLATRNSPVGTFKFDVTRPDVLQLDDRGGLLLGISVGADRSVVSESSKADASIARSAWKIEAVELEAAGQVLARIIGDCHVPR